ncbi:MAG TPA: DNA mismatch repair protein MutS, partial [Candidatus Elarobacter sp.]|nr:DNA mismatch repair protein MutS [Candidatus Elarobacter sp.]
MAKPAATPLMQQYREIKARHPGTILFFRMGDFYETFFEDAELIARVLGITLTSRNNGGASEVPLAGVPVKAGPDYVRRLVRLGHRVSICEQVEDPKTAKGVVRREVVETITPGAAFSDELLDGARNNFLCAMLADSSRIGVAAVDVSTGELRLAIVASGEMDATLARLAPREIVVPDDAALELESALVTRRQRWEFDPALARDDLTRHFNVRSLDGFGLQSDDDVALGAAGALLRYVRELQPSGIPHLHPPVVERPGGTMPLDEMTRRNLELVESLRGGADAEGTLIGVLDRTLTPMGARLLRQWILAPLTDVAKIGARLDAVGAFADDAMTRATLRAALDGVRDVERLAAKVAAGRISPRELRALGDSIARLPDVERAARRVPDDVLRDVMASWDACTELGDDIGDVLVDRPPLALGEDATVREGFDTELDELRSLRDGGKDGIARIQSDERARTGINSLKVGYNRVFGYYIEVTNAHGHRIPDDYQRRQTLTGAERYVTPALKEYEEKVLSAAERIETRERALFETLRGRIAREIVRLQCAARVIAELDVLATLAEVAEVEGYRRPRVGDGFDLRIVAGRHPVVERMMPREKFIPNDVTLTDDARVIILTGPNMAGKSTVLRQIGLIVLMAQMGSFVPATDAQIGVVDRLFTRVGASDNLVRGQSTFMVEMSETSAILHSATRASLVLLDEIGRGTSTYDGVSIAWAVTEHLHDTVGCKTIFATHYHELTQLGDQLDAVRNFNVRVREVGEEVLFLHTLDPGGADRSYGIEVGRLAGLPAPVLKRARGLLRQLEGQHRMAAHSGGRTVPTDQFGLFDTPREPHPV